MAGKSGKGSILTIGSAVTELKTINLPEVSADVLDVTTHDTPDAWRDHVIGLLDGGNLTFDGNLVSATQLTSLYTLFSNRTKTVGATLLIKGDGVPLALLTFDCFVTAIGGAVPHDGMITYTGTMKIIGKPVISDPPA